MESPPEGVVVLNVRKSDSHSLSAMWSPPAIPNGVMFYDVNAEGLFYADPGVCTSES